MRLLRVGDIGQEKVAALDSNDIMRDLSSNIKDLNPETINFDNLKKLKQIKLETLPEIKKDIRIGSCINRPSNILCIGLNYSGNLTNFLSSSCTFLGLSPTKLPNSSNCCLVAFIPFKSVNKLRPFLSHTQQCHNDFRMFTSSFGL